MGAIVPHLVRLTDAAVGLTGPCMSASTEILEHMFEWEVAVMTQSEVSGRALTPQERLAHAREALQGVEVRMGAPREAPAAAVACAPAFRDLLPQGLRRGQVVSVQGSTSLMLALTDQALSDGAWVAIVGMPDVGVMAAARRGIDLTRVALIPQPGAQAGAIMGACIDGMDVVVVGERVALSHADRRRIGARARERGSIIVAAGVWPGAHVSFQVLSHEWRGVGAGDGRLREREIQVSVQGKAHSADRVVTVGLDSPSVGRPLSTLTGRSFSQEVA